MQQSQKKEEKTTTSSTTRGPEDTTDFIVGDNIKVIIQEKKSGLSVDPTRVANIKY